MERDRASSKNPEKRLYIKVINWFECEIRILSILAQQVLPVQQKLSFLFGGIEILNMTQKHHFHSQAQRWKYYALGLFFFAKVIGWFHHTDGANRGAKVWKNLKPEHPSSVRTLKMGCGWVLQYDKIYRQGNKGLAKE